MNYEEKNRLARKIAPTTTLSVKEVEEIIDEILVNQSELRTMGYNADITIDEEYVNRVIWAKTVTGRL